MLDKETLQEIVAKALEEANVQGCAPDWRRAYLALADAAHNLEMRVVLYEGAPADVTRPRHDKDFTSGCAPIQDKGPTNPPQ